MPPVCPFLYIGPLSSLCQLLLYNTTISKTESIAHQNHKDVVYELQDENKDTPRLRLIKTKRCEISTLHDEFSRWGTYIFLTQNDLPNKISWKDEDEDANEQ